jgi:hypothetical protein
VEAQYARAWGDEVADFGGEDWVRGGRRGGGVEAVQGNGAFKEDGGGEGAQGWARQRG